MRWLELRNKQRNKETKTTKNAEHSLSSVEGECVIGSYEENSVCVCVGGVRTCFSEQRAGHAFFRKVYNVRINYNVQ